MATFSIDNDRGTVAIDDLAYDQTAGVQTPTDGNEVDVTLDLSNELDGLDSDFETFLAGLSLSQDQKDFAVLTDAAASTTNDFITVTADPGETLNDLILQADSSVALANLTTLADESIYVHVDASGNYATLWTSSDDSGRIVGAIALVGEVIDNTTTHTATAGVQMLFFEPMKHTDTTSQDESVSLGDVLKVAVDTAVSFDFDQLAAGNFLWAAVGDGDSAMLITGQDLNVVDAGNKLGDIVKGGSDPSDAVNTSKATDTTIGINAQHFAPTNSGDGAVGVFTFVKGFDQLQLATPNYTGQNVNQIAYDDYINVTSASVFISQLTGGSTADIHFAFYEAGGGAPGVDMAPGDLLPEEGYADNSGVSYSYIGNQDTDSHLKDDTEVAIYSVTIGAFTWYYNDSSNGSLQGGITVTITGNDVEVDGAQANDLITFTALDTGGSSVDGTFNRIDIQALQGSAAFDIGHIDLVEGGLTSSDLGSHLFVDDDGPSLGPINENIVDFVASSSVTDSLNGAIGTDSNASPYTLVDWTDTVTVNGVLMTGVPNDDTNPTSVTYYADTDKSGVFGDGTDIAFFKLELDQDDNSGAGSYTFTVLHDPPSNTTPFLFTDLPSGQNLFGIIAQDKTDLTKGGLLVFPTNPDINDGETGESTDGTMTKDSGTINTSKGGGPVTIGNGNQAFDHAGDGAWFVYVGTPDQSAVGGLGLNQTSADDADTINFDGTIGVNDASVTIVQASGNGTAKRPGPSMHITCYDINPGHVDTSQEARDLVTDPTATDTKVSIIEVIIKDANGNVVEDRTNLDNGADNDGALANGTTDHTVGISFILDDDGGTPGTPGDDIYSVTVSQLKAGYTVEFITDGNHDATSVEWVSGSFDIGGFNLVQNNDTPDVTFEFTAQATDGDGDAVQACWEIGVDGTGQYDGDNTLDTTVAGIEPGQPSDCVLATTLTASTLSSSSLSLLGGHEHMWNHELFV